MAFPSIDSARVRGRADPAFGRHRRALNPREGRLLSAESVAVKFELMTKRQLFNTRSVFVPTGRFRREG
jgi:hypothetical protein